MSLYALRRTLQASAAGSGRGPKVERRADSNASIMMTIADFQQMIRDRYHATDSARGPAATFIWLTEEFGELAEAIGQHLRGDGDHDNLAAEFADVLAWLATLANITGVDLTQAIDQKYIKGGGPAGTK